MPLPKLEADTLRDCLRITSQLEDKKMREIMARNTEEYIQLGKQFNYLPIKHVPILFFPNDQEKAKAMELSLAAALKSGECSSKYDDRLSASELAAWLTCPRVPADSPLRFWLPTSMHLNIKTTPASVCAAGDAMQHEKTDKNNGWRDVAFPYVIKTFRAGQFPTAKLLFQKLEHSAGVDDSPFEKGTGANKGSLYIPKISKSLALKTLQNAMKEIRSSPL